MKRLLSGILLTSGLWVLIGIAHVRAETPVIEKSQEESELFYTYYGQKIPLKQRDDIIAIAFKTKVTQSTTLPLYLKLQQDLRRNQNVSKVEVEPLGRDYALMKLSTDNINPAIMQLQVNQKGYVDSTLPVLYRRGHTEQIILPNEIIVNFDEQLSSSQKQVILQQQNLEIIRPLHFSTNRYIVKSKTESGTNILKIANQLDQITGIKSATPNFIHLRNKEISQKTQAPANQLETETAFQTNLLSQQWYLNSNPLRVCLTKFADNLDKCLNEHLYKKLDLSLPRTDIRATEAWQNSNAGKGVTVAVLDSFVQWNHPDLINNIYTVSNEVKSKLKDEKHGWDFVDNDADTRVNEKELSVLRPIFQSTFKLPDDALLEKYKYYAFIIKSSNPLYSKKQIAEEIRNYIRMETASFFHGTWISGIIAAHSQDELGIIGVAPKAKILPVTVCKIGCEISHIVEGIDYATARGADVINISLGGYLPSVEIQNAITRAYRKNPHLVIVAAAGNETDFEVGFPAAIKGVIAVGATNINGYRAPYSNFGNGLMLVAPGGDTSIEKIGLKGGILTTGGTGIDQFWQGIILQPSAPWGAALDTKGKYIRAEGTSFASPMVAGVIALMKGEDPQRLLTREQIISILKQTASYDGLTVSDAEKELYKVLLLLGKIPSGVSIEQYFFGNGLVNAHTAVKEVQRQLNKAGK
ncbi:MAG: S8 family serine peptidase [Richelia sp. RM2_1_2]|nr:S8 family serine peptidase [Richelia sp. SM2_1_7]NJM17931.1 S8 family serine peptidase [Richelia sp. SM1_7_0]NJN10271.1 S8 family serine peptidase [Richelia sp. RM1_1_1]NJO28857.1 S8 family serine peptidase [Richelia sp. SL_2_1]NJO60401.1 S8 family serine peptidase [Richelia sp. RM2_1_2]